MPPKKKLHVGLDIANFNTVAVYKWEDDETPSWVSSKNDDASEEPFSSTVYAAYSAGDTAAGTINTAIKGEKHQDMQNMAIEGFKPLFHIKRSSEVPPSIRDYLSTSCMTTVENDGPHGGILMRVRRGQLVTVVTPQACMQAFLEFLQEKIVEKTGIDLTKECEVFITASCPVDVPLSATEELKSIIEKTWTRGQRQKSTVTVSVTREPFSGALYVQNWVFKGRSSKLEYRAMQRILKKDMPVLFQVLDIGHITGQWCLLEVWWEQTVLSSVRGEGSSRVVTEETAVSVPVQRSRIVWSVSENVGSYMLTNLFKEKIRNLITDSRRSSVPETNVDSIPMHEFNLLKELATKAIMSGTESLELWRYGQGIPDIQKKAAQAKTLNDPTSMTLSHDELVSWFEEGNQALQQFLQRNLAARDECIRRYFDPKIRGEDRLRVINSPVGGGHRAYGVSELVSEALSGSISRWEKKPIVHDEQHFKISQVACGNILFIESKGKASCPSLTRKIDYNLGFVYKDDRDDEQVFYIVNKDNFDLLPKTVEYQIENLLTHEVEPVLPGEATAQQIEQGLKFKTKISFVMDRSFLPPDVISRPLKEIPRPTIFEGFALTDTDANGQEIRKVKAQVDIFKWQVTVTVSKKRGRRGDIASSSQFTRPSVEDAEVPDPPTKKDAALARKKSVPNKAQ